MNKRNEIMEIYKKIRNEIKLRLKEFDDIWQNGSEEDIFCELVFCIMTPQSKAKSCAQALEIIKDKNLIFEGTDSQISKNINIVRFRNNKAKYIVNARNLLTKDNKINLKEILSEMTDVLDKREWLVNNIKGIGYKESSHFLRNIGFGKKIAILDRHILKNMVSLSIIDEIPKTINSRVYKDFENRLTAFAKEIKIPMDYLDFVLWYKEAGEVFK